MLVSLASGRKMSAYDRRPARYDPRVPRIGPSANLLDSSPMDAVPAFFAFPSRCRTSTTDDNRPPNRGGMAPLWNVTLAIASALNIERKPKMCDGL